MPGPQPEPQYRKLPRPSPRRRPFGLPNAMNSHEEFLQVYNLDLPGMSLSGLLIEEGRAARMAEHWPDRIIWRGTFMLSVPAWANERILICERLRHELLGWEKAEARRYGSKGRPWK